MGLRIGLTGGIASGKSTVAELLAAKGAVIIDSDVLARQVVAPGSVGLARIVACFGPKVLTCDGTLDRSALGAIIFADESARAELNAIIHPLVRARRRELLAEVRPDQIAVAVIPLLAETGDTEQFDRIVVVDVPVEVQEERLMRRNQLTRAEAQTRIKAQASRAQRLKIADDVILNDGDMAELVAQVDRLWTSWLAVASD